ncbi:MAG: VOC family protein [Bacteroidota bacterium]
MDHINGLGGAFVFSNDPKRLADWYTEHLGLAFEGSVEFGAFYHQFWSLHRDDPARRLDTTFAIMQAKADFPPPLVHGDVETYGDQPFMVNLRVNDLDALLDRLQQNGIEALGRQDEAYGKFAWVRDADGHRVELYQPTMQPPEQGQASKKG